MGFCSMRMRQTNMERTLVRTALTSMPKLVRLSSYQRNNLREVAKNGFQCTFHRSFMTSSSTVKPRFWKKLFLLGTASTGIVFWFKAQNISLFSFLPEIKAARPLDPNDSNSSDNSRVISRSQKFNFIADVVEKTAPAVVYIEIKVQGRHPLFGRAFSVSNGSGFIVKDDGLILTNAHVVGNNRNVTVKLHDGRVFVGCVEDIDTIADLATLRINCKNLPTLKLGTSKKLRPGEWVVALGSPLALSNTITAGVVSTVHRGSSELGLLNHNMEYIQTDAAITDGEAIGINTMKVTPGISFAIPIDYAADFLRRHEGQQKNRWFGGPGKEQKQSPQLSKRYLGITMLSLTPALIMELQQRDPNFPDISHGVLVWRISIGSPAYTAGLQPGDVVIQINGKAVRSTDDVYEALKRQGDLKLTVVRKNHQFVVAVQPEDRN